MSLRYRSKVLRNKKIKNFMRHRIWIPFTIYTAGTFFKILMQKKNVMVEVQSYQILWNFGRYISHKFTNVPRSLRNSWDLH